MKISETINDQNYQNMSGPEKGENEQIKLDA